MNLKKHVVFIQFNELNVNRDRDSHSTFITRICKNFTWFGNKIPLLNQRPKTKDYEEFT